MDDSSDNPRHVYLDVDATVSTYWLLRQWRRRAVIEAGLGVGPRVRALVQRTRIEAAAGAIADALVRRRVHAGIAL